MRIYVSGATSTMRRLAHTGLGQNHLGHLVTPQNGNSLGSMLTSGLPWACDNAAFSNPDDTKFWNLAIDTWEWEQFNPPVWVAVPDVVGCHSQTLDYFDSWVQTWEYELGQVRFPLAFVLQNGATIATVPWDQIAAVFVGGDDAFKLRGCRDLVAEAKQRGKLVHVGRVNSLKRLEYAIELGADSVDGSGFSMFPDAKIPRALRHISHTEKLEPLFT